MFLPAPSLRGIVARTILSLSAAATVALSGTPAARFAEPLFDSLEDSGVAIQGLDDRETNAPDVPERPLRLAHRLLEPLVRLPPLLPAFCVGPPAFFVGALAFFVGALAIGSHLQPEIA